ncbi:MAG: hypothetical protein PHC38_04085 [Weeksellaceae bacterium]|nr:hypothetical protein [Weeksellaceae bacterium]
MAIQDFSLVIDILILIAGGYLIFFKSYFKEKGKNLATFEDIEVITEKVENVKKDFNIKLEGLKFELQKNNIAYQINLSELTKIRFKRIDNLYENLFVLNKFIDEVMLGIDACEEEYILNGQDFIKIYKLAVKSSIKCDLYINNELKQNIRKILNSAYSAYIRYIHLYNTDPDIFKNTSRIKVSNNELTDIYSKKNDLLIEIKSISDTNNNLLEQLISELKKEVILKDIE